MTQLHFAELLVAFFPSHSSGWYTFVLKQNGKNSKVPKTMGRQNFGTVSK